MIECDVDFKIATFPNSDKFQIFRVYGECIWWVLSVPAFNIDTEYSEYYDFVYDDFVTGEIICDMLNESEVELNG